MKLQKLPNGLKLLTVPMSNTSTATILVIVGTGSKYETKDNNGISHFLEHIFFKGTKKRPTTLAISSELDSLGAEFNAFTAKEYTGFYIKSENKNLAKALDIVSDILINPKLPAVEIEREKGVIVEEINMYLDNPMMYIEDVFENCLYGNTPAGWDTIGTKANVIKFNRQDFIKYLHAQYGSRNTVVCLVGGIGKDEFKYKQLVNRFFNQPDFVKWGNNFKEKMPVANRQSAAQVRIVYKATDQSHLSLGVRTFGYDDKDKIIVKLISIILGGSMSSRIFINLRERHGLGYYVHTNTEFYSDAGYLTTRAGVGNNEIKKAIKIILQEYKTIKEKLVGKQELQKVKDLLRGRLALQLETSDHLAEWYGRQVILNHTLERTAKKDGRILSPQEYIKEIDRISIKDVQRLAREIFTVEKLNLAIIGPFKDKKSFYKILKI